MTDSLSVLQDAENRIDAAISEQNSDPSAQIEGLSNESNVDDQELGAWLLDQGIPGAGEKPEWFSDKYKTVSEQAKAYKELEKKLGAFTGKPEDGYSFDKFKEDIDMEDEMFVKFREMASDWNMSQDKVDQMVDLFLDNSRKEHERVQKTIESLTPEQQEKAQILAQWVDNNFTEEEARKLDAFVTDVDSLELLAKMRSKMRETRIPTKGTTTSAPSEKEIQRLIIDNYDDYIKDTNGFRSRILKMLQRVEANK